MSDLPDSDLRNITKTYLPSTWMHRMASECLRRREQPQPCVIDQVEVTKIREVLRRDYSERLDGIVLSVTDALWRVADTQVWDTKDAVLVIMEVLSPEAT